MSDVTIDHRGDQKKKNYFFTIWSKQTHKRQMSPHLSDASTALEPSTKHLLPSR